jgi:hypothetical protein
MSRRTNDDAHGTVVLAGVEHGVVVRANEQRRRIGARAVDTAMDVADVVHPGTHACLPHPSPDLHIIATHIGFTRLHVAPPTLHGVFLSKSKNLGSTKNVFDR